MYVCFLITHISYKLFAFTRFSTSSEKKQYKLSARIFEFIQKLGRTYVLFSKDFFSEIGGKVASLKAAECNPLGCRDNTRVDLQRKAYDSKFTLLKIRLSLFSSFLLQLLFPLKLRSSIFFRKLRRVFLFLADFSERNILLPFFYDLITEAFVQDHH